MTLLKVLLLVQFLAISPGRAQFSGAGFWKSSMSCKNTSWGNVANGASVTAYSGTAPVGVTCASVSEVRVCANTVLSGSFSQTACSSGCPAGTTSNCTYVANSHGGSSGSCDVTYAGSCSYSCSSGARTLVSNSCTLVDTTPNAFNFTDLTGVAVSTLSTASAITPAGYTSAAAVTVSGSGSPQISINGGAWQTSGSISPGQTISVRLTSSASASTALSATVTIGGVSDVWSVTTAAPPATTWVVGFNGCMHHAISWSGAGSPCPTSYPGFTPGGSCSVPGAKCAVPGAGVTPPTCTPTYQLGTGYICQ